MGCSIFLKAHRLSISSRRPLAILFVLAVVVADAAVAGTRADGAGGTITSDVIGSGGGRMTAGSLTLNGTAGQPAVGFSSAGAAGLSHGVYKGVPPATSTCPGVGMTVSAFLDENVCLTLSPLCPVHPTTPMYQWFRQGDPVALVNSAHYFGVNSPELCINSVQVEDGGTYVLEYNDGTNPGVQHSVSLTIITESLPVSGGLGLGLLAIVCALGGAFTLSRRKAQ